MVPNSVPLNTAAWNSNVHNRCGRLGVHAARPRFASKAAEYRARALPKSLPLNTAAWNSNMHNDSN